MGQRLVALRRDDASVPAQPVWPKPTGPRRRQRFGQQVRLFAGGRAFRRRVAGPRQHRPGAARRQHGSTRRIERRNDLAAQRSSASRGSA